MITNLIRKNIQQLKPYSSARDEFKGEAEVYLDANENPYPSAYNRYPDPLQLKLKEKLGLLKGLNPSQIFLGNGSDEAIDLLIRVFCEPYQDSILITDPTYGMYSVAGEVNGVVIKRASLTSDFELDTHSIFNPIDGTTKIIFLCSPNNPSGNLLNKNKVKEILKAFSGLVVIDEAYIDFARDKGFVDELPTYPNLVILQTFSKAWGLAGLRLGMCFASEEIIQVLNKIKYPYNVNSYTQQKALDALAAPEQINQWVNEILNERENLRENLNQLKVVKRIYPSDANFLLVQMDNAKVAYDKLLNANIIVRDRSGITRCENCLRITIGTPQENKRLIDTLKEL
jgi:histidinol-phosphate aminotransferase